MQNLQCPPSKGFPYLNVEKESYEQFLLECTLSKQSKDMNFAFAKLREDTFRHLSQSKSCILDDVRRHFKRLVGIVDCCVTTYEELEDALCASYCSWFNFDILKEIRKTFLFPDGGIDEVLQCYEDKVLSYCSRRCFESPRRFHPSPSSTTMKSLVFKIDKNFDKYALNDVRNTTATVINVIKCPKYAVYVRSVQEGCVEVSCSMLPEVVVNHLDQNQICQLKESGIISLKIEGKELMKVSVNPV